MRTAPSGPCEVENYNRAYSEMKLVMSRAGNEWYRRAGIDPNNPPAWVESALRQHALFHARRVCRSGGLSGLGAVSDPGEIARQALLTTREILRRSGVPVAGDPGYAGWRKTDVDPESRADFAMGVLARGESPSKAIPYLAMWLQTASVRASLRPLMRRVALLVAQYESLARRGGTGI